MIVLLLIKCMLFNIYFIEGTYSVIVILLFFPPFPRVFMDGICSSNCCTLGYSYFCTTERLSI